MARTTRRESGEIFGASPPPFACFACFVVSSLWTAQPGSPSTTKHAKGAKKIQRDLRSIPPSFRGLRAFRGYPFPISARSTCLLYASRAAGSRRVRGRGGRCGTHRPRLATASDRRGSGSRDCQQSCRAGRAHNGSVTGGGPSRRVSEVLVSTPVPDRWSARQRRWSRWGEVLRSPTHSRGVRGDSSPRRGAGLAPLPVPGRGGLHRRAGGWPDRRRNRGSPRTFLRIPQRLAVGQFVASAPICWNRGYSTRFCNPQDA